MRLVPVSMSTMSTVVCTKYTGVCAKAILHTAAHAKVVTGYGGVIAGMKQNNDSDWLE